MHLIGNIGGAEIEPGTVIRFGRGDDDRRHVDTQAVGMICQRPACEPGRRDDMIDQIFGFPCPPRLRSHA